MNKQTHCNHTSTFKLSRAINTLPQVSDDETLAHHHIQTLQRTGKFILFSQPLVNIASRSIVSMEVLLRHRANSGKITPPTFLTSFAKLGLIPVLDMWVINHALAQISTQRVRCGFKLSINVSPQTFLIEGFASSVLDMIERSGLGYHQIELEVTEDVLIQDESQIREVFNQLKSAGISIALDDFGTGYSTIGNLISYQYDKVKIDRSLVSNITNKNGREILRLTTDLVKLSSAEIVVEGVETSEELEFVSSLGIESVQGYYFYKPMPFEEALVLLST
ncbi:EAL domain-containing protein [Vibrio bivalvicida]|uniref:EAL domain-containing protein n=1 Tax=Vibrio bivalvicida TaxID=1276888 RepID=A0ABV4MHR6_9VIBR